MRLPDSAPRSRQELLERARAIGGMRIDELAAKLARVVPDDARRGKGLAGALVERALGVAPSSRSGPDCASIDVEIKSIPLRPDGRPTESTYVCTAPRAAFDAAWERSAPRAKLACVLFVPVEHAASGPLGRRRVGAAWLWSPSADEDALLRGDWESLRDRVLARDLSAIDARLGRALQVRPKARDASARARSHDADGAPVAILPRGLYLRASFTATLVPR